MWPSSSFLIFLSLSSPTRELGLSMIYSHVLTDGQSSVIYSIAEYKYSAQIPILVGFLVKFTEGYTVLYKLIIGRRGLRCHFLPVCGITHRPFQSALQM